MNCDDCQSDLPSLLLHELSDQRAAEVSAHLRTECPSCCEQYAELAASINRLDSLTDLVQTGASESISETSENASRDRVWNLIHQQIQGNLCPETHSSSVQASNRMPATTTSSGSAVSAISRPIWISILAVACGFLIIASVRLASDSNLSIFGLNPFRATKTADVTAVDPFERNDRIDHLKTVLLKRAENPRISCGLLVFDSFVSQIHVYLDQLPTLDTRDRYVFWFLDDSGMAVGNQELQVNEGSVRQVIDFPPGKLFSSTVITIETKSTTLSQPSDRIAVTQGDSADEA